MVSALGRPSQCGRCGACRCCVRAARERARWRALSIEQRRERIARRVIDAERKRAEVNRRRASEDYRRKQRARAAVNNAIKRGELQRGCCEVCGEPEAQAHHTDYDRPLDVRWRCFTHHLAEHLLPEHTTNHQEDPQNV